MAGKSANYSILVDVEFNTKQVQQNLQRIFDNYKATVKVEADATNLERVSDAAKEAEEAVNGANKSAEDLSLTYQVANQIFHKTVEVISDMVEQVFELDSAMIEFQKVSDLSGVSLDNYVNELTELGTQVARTG